MIEIEDKLTSVQRIRLESVAQANARMTTVLPDRTGKIDPVEQLLDAAGRIETFITGGEPYRCTVDTQPMP